MLLPSDYNYGWWKFDILEPEMMKRLARLIVAYMPTMVNLEYRVTVENYGARPRRLEFRKTEDGNLEFNFFTEGDLLFMSLHPIYSGGFTINPADGTVTREKLSVEMLQEVCRNLAIMLINAKNSSWVDFDPKPGLKELASAKCMNMTYPIGKNYFYDVEYVLLRLANKTGSDVISQPGNTYLITQANMREAFDRNDFVYNALKMVPFHAEVIHRPGKDGQINFLIDSKESVEPCCYVTGIKPDTVSRVVLVSAADGGSQILIDEEGSTSPNSYAIMDARDLLWTLNECLEIYQLKATFQGTRLIKDIFLEETDSI